MSAKNVLILGASAKSDRYAYKAMKKLEKAGHATQLVNPGLTEIEGQKVYTSIQDYISAQQPVVDTVTVYVKSDITTKSVDEIMALQPKRVIFNPGSENPSIYNTLKMASIEVVEGCTLVMLSTQQF